MIVTKPDGSVSVYDGNGVCRVRMGVWEEGPSMEVFHVTRDGEYRESFEMRAGDYDAANLVIIRQTYANCDVWCLSATQWCTISAAGLGILHWRGIDEHDVPKEVRLAEIMR